MTMILWTTGDMARELGIATTTASNWGAPRRFPVPEPYAVHGPLKVRLWTGEQAAQIMAEYRSLQQARADREAEIERGKRVVAEWAAG